MREASIRDWPYPYRAALAFSNDADWMSWRSFSELFTYLNTTRTTALGSGLGLEVTSNFFPYTLEPEREFALFDGLEPRPSGHAGAIAELVRSGHLDALHTWGNFDPRIAFERVLAERAIDELVRRDLRLRVWINHGGVNNIQNLGGPDGTYHHGDRRGSSAFHADLTMAYGVRYYWSDLEITRLFALPTRDRLSLTAFARQPRVMVHRFASDLLRYGCKSAVGRLLRGKTLLRATALASGERLWNLLRFRFRDRRKYAPHLGNLADQLGETDLTELRDSGDAVVIYQHFGVTRGQDGVLRPNEPVIIPEPTRRAFERVAAARDAGTLWVPGLAKLLRYVDTRNALVVGAERVGGATRFVLSRGADAVGVPIGLDAADLAGITIYTDAPERASLVIEGEPSPLPLRANPPDHTGRASATVPLVSAEWPL